MTKTKSCWAALATALLPLFSLSAVADDGLWTFDAPPLAALETRHQFKPAASWLEHLRLAAVRFGGGSASFVSPRGLVLTNHHVGNSCIRKLSSEKRDLIKTGFHARNETEELPCPDTELRVLHSMSEVSREVLASQKPGMSGDDANKARKTAIAELERRCMDQSRLRCEVISLYHGAAYHLYRSYVWKDVRLVFAPEKEIAFFGGDPDNFVFPRFDLDLALFRVYENGKPVSPPKFLKTATTGVQESDLVFAAGHPHTTDRLFTVAELEAQRDLDYPLHIASAKRQRAMLLAFGAASPEAARRAEQVLFGTENWLKAMLGEYKTLRDPSFFAAKREEERRFRQEARKTDASADPWTRIAAITAKRAAKAREIWAVDYGYRTLLRSAGEIVEIAYETDLPEGERLSEYRGAELPRLKQRLEADYPIHQDLETARLAEYWTEAQELLGSEHAFVKTVLNGRTPAAAAQVRVAASQLDSAAERRRLLAGGIKAVEASRDPLIVLAREIYPLRRALARFAEVEVETPAKQAAEELGRLRFAVFGKDVPPDATGTLRLSFGVVKGYDADGVLTPWKTNFGGLFARHDAFDGKPPFSLPQSWNDARGKLNPATPFNFVSTIDIIGGNSGSPVVNRAGELVGLIFDGNLESLGNRFGYTETSARSLAVDARAILEALETVYGAKALAAEMRGH